MRETIEILGVRIAAITTQEALNGIKQFIVLGRTLRNPHIVCTPNASHVMIAQRDKEFRDIVNRADLAIPDGMGIVYASRVLGRYFLSNVGGRLLMMQICRIAAEKGYSIFLLGAAPGVAHRASIALRELFPALEIAGVFSPRLGFDLGDQDDLEAVKLVKHVHPDILFVSFGAPKQEKWIYHHLNELNVPVSMGVGYALDIISGSFPEPPQWMTEVGLEWLFRLIREPNRLGRRYLVDGPRFLYLILREAVSRRSREMPD